MGIAEFKKRGDVGSGAVLQGAAHASQLIHAIVAREQVVGGLALGAAAQLHLQRHGLGQYAPNELLLLTVSERVVEVDGFLGATEARNGNQYGN